MADTRTVKHAPDLDMGACTWPTLAAWLTPPRPSAPPVPAASPAAVPPTAIDPDTEYPSEPYSYEALTRAFDPDAPPPLPPDSPAARPVVSFTAGWRGAIASCTTGFSEEGALKVCIRLKIR